MVGDEDESDTNVLNVHCLGGDIVSGGGAVTLALCPSELRVDSAIE